MARVFSIHCRINPPLSYKNKTTNGPNNLSPSSDNNIIHKNSSLVSDTVQSHVLFFVISFNILLCSVNRIKEMKDSQ